MAMNKVCIARADSGLVPNTFWIENAYYMESQHACPGITAFARALIDYTIQKTKRAKWAMQCAVANPLSKHNYWVSRLEDTGEWVIYDIFVNMNDKDYLFWKLTQ